MSVQRIGPRGSALSIGSPGLSNIIGQLLSTGGSSHASALPNDNATLVTLNRNSFGQRLEKHLSDYRAGKGYLSENVGSEVLAKGENLANQLDPKSLTNYSAYTTGLSYTARARFINNIADTAARLKDIVA